MATARYEAAKELMAGEAVAIDPFTGRVSRSPVSTSFGVAMNSASAGGIVEVKLGSQFGALRRMIAVGGIGEGDEIVFVAPGHVRAKATSDPNSVSLGIARTSYKTGDPVPIRYDGMAERRSKDALAAGEYCNSAADGHLWGGLLSPFGPGRPAIALHSAHAGEDVVIRFIAEAPLAGPEPPVEESLERLGAALADLAK